jgi:cellulose biosynthesis protein BcsQ
VPRDARRVAFGNNKGGAMKTTWCKEIAATLARRGHSVLVIDMDPQANLTRRMGIVDDPAKPMPTVSEAVKQDQEGCIAGAIVECGWDDPAADNIDVVPSRIDLELRVSEAAALGSVLRLRRALQGVAEDYDWVLMDCAPSMGHLTHMALAAADAVIVPIVPEYDHVTGGRRMVEFIAAYRDQIYSPHLEPLAVLVGGLRDTTALHSFHIEGLPEVFPGLLWEPAIPHRTKIAEAQDKAMPVHAYDPQLAREMVPRYDAIATRLEEAMA